MKRFVIYTALVGDYDGIIQPEVVDENFDYILFSNDINESMIGVWQVRPIPYTDSIPTKIARYVKTHPEELLGEYKCSIWVDANITIKSDFIYKRAYELYDSKVLISSMYHLWTHCAYDEMFNVLHCMYEHEEVILKWGHILRNDNYPLNNGLHETNVLFRVHSNQLIIQFNQFWWSCIYQYSKRDQLSFDYSLWKYNLQCPYFLPEGKNVRNTEHFELLVHKKNIQNFISLNKNEAWLMRYCWKDKSKTQKVKQIYYSIYSLPFPQLWAFLIGQCFRLKYRIELLLL